MTIRTGDFVSVAQPNQIYRITKMIGSKVSLRLVNGSGPATLDEVEVSECKFEYADPRVKVVQYA